MTNLYYNFLFLGLVALDQITKLIFSNRDFFVGPLHIHSVKNYGLAFSLNFGLAINIIIVVLGLSFFAYYYFRHRKLFSNIGNAIFILILAGGISNIIDRIYFGYVRDFLDLGLGFTFNLSDLFIVSGLLMVLLYKIPIEQQAN